MRVFWIAVICALAYGGYVLYRDWWNTGTGVSRAKEYVQNVLGKKSNEIKNQAQEKASVYVSEVVGEAKQSAVDYVKQKASDAVSSVGKGILNGTAKIFGITPKSDIPQTGVFQGGTVVSPSGSGFVAPPPPATITANVGFPLVFSVNKDASYTVNWGDGKSDSGVSTSNEAALLKHIWNKEGDYTVKITVNGFETSTDYIFPVRIYKLL